MWTTEDQTVAAGHSVMPARWQVRLEELLGRVAGRFGRVEPRRRAQAFVLDPAAVLVIDETGDLKKGARTVGVGRRYTGTAGKVDNAQVAVDLSMPPRPGTG